MATTSGFEEVAHDPIFPIDLICKLVGAGSNRECTEYPGVQCWDVPNNVCKPWYEFIDLEIPKTCQDVCDAVANATTHERLSQCYEYDRERCTCQTLYGTTNCEDWWWFFVNEPQPPPDWYFPPGPTRPPSVPPPRPFEPLPIDP